MDAVILGGFVCHLMILLSMYRVHINFLYRVRVEESYYDILGAVSIRKTVLPGMAIPMLKIRRPNGRLIFNMEITIRR